jgi:hypothetical protein
VNVSVLARSSASVFVFDLGVVGEWLERFALNGRLEGSALPPCRELRSVPFVAGDSSFRFLHNGDYAILTAGAQVFGWSLRRAETPCAIHISWKFRYKEVITCMEPLSSDTVLLGTCNGRFAILNWRKVVLASFSTCPTPTLVEEWTSYIPAGPIQKRMEIPSPEAMGIRQMTVVRRKLANDLVRCKLCWVTCCGWVLSTSLELRNTDDESTHSLVLSPSVRRSSKCESLHTTRPIKWRNSKGSIVNHAANKMWVVPSFRIPTTAACNALIWQRVEDDVTKLVPDPDRRVLYTEASLETATEHTPSSIHWLSLSHLSDGMTSCSIQTIPLSPCTEPPSSLAVHPDHEWFVVGTAGKGLVLFQSRSKMCATKTINH